MNVVNPNNTSHELQIIPRFYPTDELVFNLSNEATQIETNLDIIYLIENGILTFTFDFDFINGQKFQFKILEGTQIVYRGKIIATTQETQNYLTDKDEYYYE